MIESWYRTYWSQTWYANTFLVRRPDQVGRAVAGDREWNNVYDSGCNFTCLAMIVGIDPGRLASELRTANYFFADRNLPAKRLDGRLGGLVWDQNAPNRSRQLLVLENIWHPQLQRRTTITLNYIGTTATRSYVEAKARVAEIQRSGHHAICGPVEHSHLIAGKVDEDYFLWDPDGSEKSVEKNLAGEVRLRDLFRSYADSDIEFWEYECVAA